MDRDWWKAHADDVARFSGEKLCPLETREAKQLRAVQERNTMEQALGREDIESFAFRRRAL